MFPRLFEISRIQLEDFSLSHRVVAMIQIYLYKVLSLSARIAFTIVEAPQAQAVEATVSQRNSRKCDLSVMAHTFIIEENSSCNHSVQRKKFS